MGAPRSKGLFSPQSQGIGIYSRWCPNQGHTGKFAHLAAAVIQCGIYLVSESMAVAV